MKNIIIAGVPFSGKSTLSKMLIKEVKHFDYSYIEGDIINTAFFASFLETFGTMKNLSKFDACREKNLAKNFVLNLLSIYNSSEVAYNIIYDTAFLDIKTLNNLKNNGFVVIVLGYPKLKEKTLRKHIKKTQNESDRSSSQKADALKREIKNYVVSSKELKMKCDKLNIKFFDTSFNRERVFDAACKYIIEQIMEE